MTERISPVVFALAALVSLPWAVHAGRDVSHDEALRLAEQGELRPLQSIVDAALARYPGRLLEAELEHEDGDYRYEIEIVTKDGRVTELEFDGRTGRLLDVDEDEDD
ncbi:Peptidase propeptide and YPEB domain-containing protein [Halopseudomonas xinjiangensis]|uniref:Peptidase propeptide and YPEB domain-containing protein n=1 Tax=Halopseudomonas xinjiangensis TaxID=487184 RepID=A0A1H1SHB6_9GAMM|nr:PepSY domain-containing protein [Halopseudomonas xinjiangensis]SDS47116.1 Peptidase propeptide and YPEB domain-containing protein [Halopseudomonas xinjiangensis]